MTANLLNECKKGLGLSTEPNDLIDANIEQKINIVLSFLKKAGVSDENLNDDLTVGVIVLGVTDLWNLNSGEIKFSPAFYTLVAQLAAG